MLQSQGGSSCCASDAVFRHAQAGRMRKQLAQQSKDQAAAGAQELARENAAYRQSLKNKKSTTDANIDDEEVQTGALVPVGLTCAATARLLPAELTNRCIGLSDVYQ